MFYDDSFHIRFGSSANERITSIITILKGIFALPSLTTVLEPEVVGVTYKPGQTWTATGSSLE